MITFIEKKRPSLTYRILCGFVAFTFAFGIVLPPQMASAQVMPVTVLNLPAPGTMVPVSTGYVPTLVTGITIHPENPLEFDFMINTGDSALRGDALKDESQKLIKYFLASLTVPEEELWVNLSPYEEGRIIPQVFGETEMGRDLLAQDYLLKQLTASLMYPEDELGKKFWDRVYKKAYDLYGTTEIPMNTFNKVWIMPDTAMVLEKDASAYVLDSRLKVMLEEDYIALKNNMGNRKFSLNELQESDAEVISGVTSAVVREVLIPEIEKEVNEGETFANLRQIYNSMILATWYKQNLKESLLGQVYVDQNKIKGVDVDDKQIKEKIYDQYLEAFKKGVYNYIREDYDPVSQGIVPRKYFSGGGYFRSLGKDIDTIVPADLLKRKPTPEQFISFLLLVKEMKHSEFDEIAVPIFNGFSADKQRYILDQVTMESKNYGTMQFEVNTVLIENAEDGDAELVLPKSAGTAASPVQLSRVDQELLQSAESEIAARLKRQFDSGAIDEKAYKLTLNKAFPNLKKFVESPNRYRLDPGAREGNLSIIREANNNPKLWDLIINAHRGETPFGTAGIRNIMAMRKSDLEKLDQEGVNAAILKGKNTINITELLLKTQALLEVAGDQNKNTFVTGYDSRVANPQFMDVVWRHIISKSTPENPIKIYGSDRIMPFPVILWAIQELNADYGVYNSASHNPPKYLGWKAAMSTDIGKAMQLDAQMKKLVTGKLEQDDELMLAKINPVDSIAEAQKGQFIWLGGPQSVEGVDYHGFEKIDIITPYIEHLEQFIVDQSVIDEFGSELNIGYAAYNGAGAEFVPALFNKVGFTNFKSISSLQNPNGFFPAFNYEEQPDPGDPIAAEIAVREYKKEYGEAALNDVDILIGTDPDDDRMGAVTKIPDHLKSAFGNQSHWLVPANDAWVVINWYRFMKRQELGQLDPNKTAVVFSHVTSNAIEAVANLFGVKAKGKFTDVNGNEMDNYLKGRRTKVGFQYLGEMFNYFEEQGFDEVFGGEESNGTSNSKHIMDKDGNLAALEIAEAAAYAKSQGKTLFELIMGVYEQLGGHTATANKGLPRVGAFEGAAGIFDKINLLRHAQEKWMVEANERANTDNPLIIGGRKVIGAVDFVTGQYVKDHFDYEKFPAEGIRFFFEDANLKDGQPFYDSKNYITIRPSGTSQMLRFYVETFKELKGSDQEKAAQMFQNYKEANQLGLLAQVQLLEEVGLIKYLSAVKDQLDALEAIGVEEPAASPVEDEMYNEEDSVSSPVLSYSGKGGVVEDQAWLILIQNEKKYKRTDAYDDKRNEAVRLTDARIIPDVYVTGNETDPVTYGAILSPKEERIYIQASQLKRIQELNDHAGMLSRIFIFLLKEGDELAKRKAAYDYARNKYKDITDKLLPQDREDRVKKDNKTFDDVIKTVEKNIIGIDLNEDDFRNYVGLGDNIVFKNANDVEFLSHSRRLLHMGQLALYKIATNALDKKIDLQKTFIIDYEKKDEQSVGLKDSDVRAGMLAFAANPLTGAHYLIATYKAMAESEVDTYFVSPTKGDFRKPALRATYEKRLELSRNFLEPASGGLIQIMPELKSEAENDTGVNGEEKVLELIEMNKDANSIDLFYGAGADHFYSFVRKKDKKGKEFVKFETITEKNINDFVYYVKMNTYPLLLNMLMKIESDSIPKDRIEFLKKLAETMDAEERVNLIQVGEYAPVLDTMGKLFLIQHEIKSDQVKLGMLNTSRGEQPKDILRDELGVEVVYNEGADFDIAATILRKGITKLINEGVFDFKMFEAMPTDLLRELLKPENREYFYSLVRVKGVNFDEAVEFSNSVDVLFPIDQEYADKQHEKLKSALERDLESIKGTLEVEDGRDTDNNVSVVTVRENGVIVLQYVYAVKNGISDDATGDNTIITKYIYKPRPYLTIKETEQVIRAIQSYVKKYNSSVTKEDNENLERNNMGRYLKPAITLNERFKTLRYSDTKDQDLNMGKKDEITILMILGNDDIHGILKVLDFKKNNVGDYLVISGGEGSLMKKVVQMAEEQGVPLPSDVETEAEIMRNIMVNFAANEEKWKSFAPDLKDPEKTLLEKKSRYTVENFSMVRDILKEKGLLSKEKTTTILYIQKPLQQLRAKGAFESVFYEEIESGKVRGLSYPVISYQTPATGEYVIGEYFRIVANAQRRGDGRDVADWYFPNEGLDKIPNKDWKEASLLFKTLPAEKRWELRDELSAVVYRMGLNGKQLLNGLKNEIKSFVKLVFEDPIEENESVLEITPAAKIDQVIAEIREMKEGKKEIIDIKKTKEWNWFFNSIIMSSKITRKDLKRLLVSFNELDNATNNAIESAGSDETDPELKQLKLLKGNLQIQIGALEERIEILSRSENMENVRYDGKISASSPVKGEEASEDLVAKAMREGYTQDELNNLKKKHRIPQEEKGKRPQVVQPSAVWDAGRPETAGSPVGGIDLNPDLLDLQIRRDGNGIPLPVSQQPIYNMHIDGFLPVIINIMPVTTISPMLLGMLDEAADDDSGLSFNPALDPVSRIDPFTLEEREETESLI